MKLTLREIARASNGIAIVSRPNKDEPGGYVVMAVYVDKRRAEGSLVGTPFIEYADRKAGVSKQARDIARWLDKCGYDCPLADASRARNNRKKR